MPRSADLDPPFRHALVAVCRGCSGREPKPKEVRSRLRAAFKAAGLRKVLRVVETSCLDLCPKRAVAVVVARTGPSGPTTCHAVDGEDGLDRLAASLAAEAAAGS